MEATLPPIDLYSLKWPKKPQLRFFWHVLPRVDRPFFQRTWVKVIGVSLVGATANFVIEILLSLIYRNYPVLEDVWSYIGATVVAVLIYLVIRYINKRLDSSFPWEENPLRRFVVQAIADVTFTVVCVLLLKMALPFITQTSGFTNFQDSILTTVVVGFFTLIFVLVDLSGYLMNSWRLSLAEMEQFKKESVESQLQMLKTQVNPHFLFNSLNTLNSLIHQDQDTATSFVRQLSRVYRYVLESRNQEVISLREELDVINAYIYLLEIRFRDAISFEVDIREEDLDQLIGPMTLQMLIENAIKHNIVSKRKPLTISISTRDDGMLVVCNNLQIKEEAEASTAVGLRNIRSRYAFLTERGIEIVENDRDFCVLIPLVNADERTDY